MESHFVTLSLIHIKITIIVIGKNQSRVPALAIETCRNEQKQTGKAERSGCHCAYVIGPQPRSEIMYKVRLMKLLRNEIGIFGVRLG